MKAYPLLFSFRDLIAGKGFVAHVAIDGRALLRVESGEGCWVDGVQPGALADGAAEQAAALSAFKDRYQSVLFDIAQAATSYDEFERDVREFFAQSSDETEWQAALDEARVAKPSLSSMPTWKAENNPPQIVVKLIDSKKAEPTVNALDTYANAA